MEVNEKSNKYVWLKREKLKRKEVIYIYRVSKKNRVNSEILNIIKKFCFGNLIFDNKSMKFLNFFL